ncbi:response regulator [Nocardiopsis alba]|uniref:response regulator n=1 Tax=Nocardiopsis alba TaxID=53437 RepID=UPI0035DBB42C
MSKENGATRVFLLDDHDVVRQGIMALLQDEEDIEVVGEAATASEALGRIPAARPDVAVLDVRLPDGNGVEVCRELQSRPDAPVCLMLTSYSDDEALYASVMAGAAGYVLKQIHGSDLVGAIRTVASGESLLDPHSTARILRRLREGSETEDPLPGFSDKERLVFELIGEGLTNRQIGERIFLAEKTVKNHVSSVLSKLGMRRRSQAAAHAARLRARSEQGGSG